jgi:hypothetical protein
VYDKLIDSIPGVARKAAIARLGVFYGRFLQPRAGFCILLCGRDWGLRSYLFCTFFCGFVQTQNPGHKKTPEQILWRFFMVFLLLYPAKIKRELLMPLRS